MGGASGQGWQVINDCGYRDIWPVLAQTITWGYGSSGRFGFGHGRVKDRFHGTGHSGFLEPDFVEKYWVPYFSKDEIVNGESSRPTTSLLLSIATVFKVRYLIFGSPVGLAVYLLFKFVFG